MVVHISLFYLHDPESADAMVEALNRVPAADPAIVSSCVGRNWGAPPPAPGLPDFADVGQVITFADEKSAAEYAFGEAHAELRKATDHLVKRVAAVDFVQDE